MYLFLTRLPFLSASKFGIIMSDIGIGSVLAVLAYYAHTTSWANMFRMYVIPYIMMNHWIVLLVFVRPLRLDIARIMGLTSCSMSSSSTPTPLSLISERAHGLSCEALHARWTGLSWDGRDVSS